MARWQAIRVEICGKSLSNKLFAEFRCWSWNWLLRYTSFRNKYESSSVAWEEVSVKLCQEKILHSKVIIIKDLVNQNNHGCILFRKPKQEGGGGGWKVWFGKQHINFGHIFTKSMQFLAKFPLKYAIFSYVLFMISDFCIFSSFFANFS